MNKIFSFYYFSAENNGFPRNLIKSFFIDNVCSIVMVFYLFFLCFLRQVLYFWIGKEVKETLKPPIVSITNPRETLRGGSGDK